MLLRHPGVKAVAVVGRPHPDLVEEVVAFVVPADPDTAPSPEELDRICLEHLARYKGPRHYELVASLPENPYGKVLKRELRSTWHGNRRTAAPRPRAQQASAHRAS